MTSHTERIVVIDHQLDTRLELDRLLQAKGFYVRAFEDLAHALDCLTLTPPDLVFADIPAPAVAELIASLRTAHRHTSLVACTATTEASDVVALLRAGAADILLKPYADKSSLDDVLSKLFERLRLSRLNQVYRNELEESNRDLRAGIAELRADQNAGRKVQMRMLPDNLAELYGLHMEHLVKPSLYLSGDFLDHFRLDDDRVLVYIADVSGHGASSAFVTVLLKNLTNRLQRNLRRGTSEDVLHPDRFLQRINSELLDTGLGKHLTMFVGIINVHEHTLHYSVGAHFPLPILSGPDSTEFLPGSGMPIGLFEDPVWDVRCVNLPDPFTLVMFSDGILEVIKARSLDAKEACLLELVSSGRHTIAALSQALNLDEISELPDDIAIMTVTNRVAN